MNWNKIWKSVKKASPLMCTILGVAGVVGTAVLTAKCTPKAIERVQHKQESSTEPLRPLNKVVVAAPAYLPAISVGALTILSIITSQHLNTKQNLALASSCAILQHHLKDYKAEVKKLFGQDADLKVEKEIGKKRIDWEKVKKLDHTSMDQLYIWYEPNTGVTFEATEAEVLKAEYEVNKRIQTNGCCSLKEYCELLRIDAPEGAEWVGWDYQDFIENWDPDRYWVDFDHELIVDSDENMPPYYIIHTPISPEWNYELDARPVPDLYIDDNGCYAYDVR